MLLLQLTLEEKVSLLTGDNYMMTAAVERVGLKAKRFADGPHGVRISSREGDCTAFPNLCTVGATWDTALVEKMGVALARDCIAHEVDCILGPGVNIKRHIRCGRNFEYVSEDPVIAGEIGAAYVNGVQSLGVATSLKHYAFNNQELDRLTVNADVDLRTAMELYLKPFEIVVKKAGPKSIMCAYNKFHAIWCAENKYLLTEILRDTWGYDGYVVSDWGAVHNPSRSFAAGLDLQMPGNDHIQEQIAEGLKQGLITEADIDRAAGRVIAYLLDRPETDIVYDRDEQHRIAREVAAAGCVLLKNENNLLPITKEKYKKIAVIGEYAKNPLMQGQGSAEVYPDAAYIDSPIAELQKLLGDGVEIKYLEMYKKAEFHTTMQWGRYGEVAAFVADADLVLFFVGDMESSDTENFDRRTAELSPYQGMFINNIFGMDKKIAVINQSGSAMIFGSWANHVDAIVHMGLGGEAAGGGIADVLCGVVNPSGRLAETFPTQERTDLSYHGAESALEYSEGLAVGYRYYDAHPDEIAYPFGFGLSYTDFTYDHITVEREGDAYAVSFDLKNTGAADGAEVVQLYSSDPASMVNRPQKELRAFSKVFLKAGETKRVTLRVPVRDLGYYNVLLRDWVTEPGAYLLQVGASSQDIRLCASITVSDAAPYSMTPTGECTIG